MPPRTQQREVLLGVTTEVMNDEFPKGLELAIISKAKAQNPSHLALRLDGKDVRRPSHGLGLDDVIVQERDNVVHARHEKRSRLLVGSHLKLQARPFIFHRG